MYFFFKKKSIFGHKAYIFAVGMPTSSSNSFQSTLFIKRLYRLHIHSGCCLCRCITLLCNDMYFAYTCIYNYYVSALLVVGAVVRLCIKAPLFPLNCVGCLFKFCLNDLWNWTARFDCYNLQSCRNLLWPPVRWGRFSNKKMPAYINP